MTPYPNYKPSGIEWIGDIPSHWDYVRLKYVALVQLSNVDKKTNEGEVPVLLCNYVDVYNNDFIDDSIVFMQASATSNEIEKFNILKGDVLITKDSETPDEIAKPALVIHDLKNVICAYHLAQIRCNRNYIFGEYLFRLFQENKFNSQFEVAAHGITRYGISVLDISDANILLPPLPEQSAIANFLDEKTSQIDKLISNKQKLIQLLKEERTAVINEAVSGEGKNWERKKLKYVVSKIGSGITPTGGASVYLQEGIPLLRSQNIYSEGLRLDDVAYINDEIDEQMSNSRIQDHDVLLNITGASIGRCFYVPKNFGRGNVNQHVCILRPIQSKIKTEFLHSFLISGMGQNLIDAFQNGANREGLNFQQIKSFEIPLPEISEQDETLKYIQAETGRIDATISKIEKEIELMNEYRTALISEVVTGKIKISYL